MARIRDGKRREFLSDVNQELAEEVVSELASQFGSNNVEEMLSSVVLHMRYERTPAKMALIGFCLVSIQIHVGKHWQTLLMQWIICASAKGLFA